jgi:hypothetical protein
MMLAWPERENDLQNYVEVRQILNYEEPVLEANERQPSLQQFLSKPIANGLYLELTLAILKGQVT